MFCSAISCISEKLPEYFLSSRWLIQRWILLPGLLVANEIVKVGHCCMEACKLHHCWAWFTANSAYLLRTVLSFAIAAAQQSLNISCWGFKQVWVDIPRRIALCYPGCDTGISKCPSLCPLLGPWRYKIRRWFSPYPQIWNPVAPNGQAGRSHSVQGR